METVVKEVETKKQVVEVVQIEVPDYSEDVEKLKNIINLQEESVQVKNKTIDANSSNILAQIEAYLVEVFKPLFDENGNTTIFVSGFGGWRGSKCYIIDLDYSDFPRNGDYAITPTGIFGYNSHSDFIQYEHPFTNLDRYKVLKIVSNWPDIKKRVTEAIKKSLQEEAEAKAKLMDKTLQEVNMIANFKI